MAVYPVTISLRAVHAQEVGPVRRVEIKVGYPAFLADPLVHGPGCFKQCLSILVQPCLLNQAVTLNEISQTAQQTGGFLQVLGIGNPDMLFEFDECRLDTALLQPVCPAIAPNRANTTNSTKGARILDVILSTFASSLEKRVFFDNIENRASFPNAVRSGYFLRSQRLMDSLTALLSYRTCAGVFRYCVKQPRNPWSP